MRPVQSSSQKGVAIVAVLALIVILVTLAQEIWLIASVDYGLFGTSVDVYQAQLNARSGLELSLWRLTVYQKLSAQANQLGQPGYVSYLNWLWQLPLNWPLKEVSSNPSEASNGFSSWPGGFTTQIEDEGSKIDVNDLAHPDETIRQKTQALLVTLLQEWGLQDEKWEQWLKDYPPSRIVARLQDWIDGDRQALPEGSETESNLNRFFQNPLEILSVTSLPTHILESLSQVLTCFGAKGINPNAASTQLLKILDRSFTDEIITAILDRRQNPTRGGPFQNSADFWSFVSNQGARITPDRQALIPLVFDRVTSFHITVTGFYNQKSVTWDVYVWDYNASIRNLAQTMAENVLNNFRLPPKVQNQASNPSQGTLPIVYWRQR